MSDDHPPVRAKIADALIEATASTASPLGWHTALHCADVALDVIADELQGAYGAWESARADIAAWLHARPEVGDALAQSQKVGLWLSMDEPRADWSRWCGPNGAMEFSEDGTRWRMTRPAAGSAADPAAPGGET